MKLMKFQVKNKKKNSSLLIKYREEMRNVADLILSRLTYNKIAFESKLRQLNVWLEPAQTTSGYLEIDYNKNISKIVMKINPSESINYIRFIMAHELYHLLFAAGSPVASMGYNFTDHSYQVNAIIRRNFDGEYGTQLNEQIANLLGFETIAQNLMPEEKDADITLWNDFEKFYQNLLTPVKSLVDSFDTGNSRGWNLEGGVQSEDNRFVPDNLFLFGCVNGRSEGFVSAYEKVMGNHSWQRLNKMIDLFYVGCTSKGVEPFEKVVYESIFEELNRFNMFSSLKKGA